MTDYETTEPSTRSSSRTKQFGTILGFELKGYFSNKIFVGITVFLMLAIVIVTFFPRIQGSFSSGSQNSGSSAGSDSAPGGADAPVMLVSCDLPENEELVTHNFTMAFTDYRVQIMDNDTAAIKKQITEGQAECAFVLTGLTSYTYYVNDLSMYDQNTAIANELLQNMNSLNAMVQGGLTTQQATDILTAQIEHETVNLGKDQIHNFFYTYIMIFALYIVIIMYGQMIATSVATEKSSRAMELLITSAKPVSMMFGKVIAACLAGLIQLIAVFGTGLVCFQLNRSYWKDNQLISSVFDMPVWLLGYMLLFFILGFFIYAFLYGAIGSTASKVEDINTSVMPVTLLFIVAFFVTMFSLGNGTVDSLLMKICSFIPFTSPMAMFTRLAMSTVETYEIILSVVLLLVSVTGVGLFSAKIYRVGVLLYGTKPKPGAILRAIRNA